METLRLVLRSLRIGAILMTAAGAYAFRRVDAGDVDATALEALRGQVLARTLERLGATFVKLGQILSTRPDLLGRGYVCALARLQDRVPPAPFRAIEAVLAADLSREARARLATVDPEPLAAASVAQVHCARTTDGALLALKVQRPSARAHIERDLTLLGLGARLISTIPSVRLLSLPGAVERFGAAMRAQLDFRLEADNNRRFAENLGPLEGVGVPELAPGLCTERVLAMELVRGVRATEPEKVGRDRSLLARRGAECILQMVFIDGFVHADLHPGNILLTDDGRIVLIDLGLVAEIPDDMRRPWIDTFVALAGRDGRKASRLFYCYAPHVGTDDYAAYERDVIAQFEPLHGKKLGEVEVGAVVGGLMNVLRRHRVQIDPVFTVVHIAMLVAEGLGKQLDPDIDLLALATPYLVRALASAPPGRPPLRQPGGMSATAA